MRNNALFFALLASASDAVSWFPIDYSGMDMDFHAIDYTKFDPGFWEEHQKQDRPDFYVPLG